jgi:hypothetical protein
VQGRVPEAWNNRFGELRVVGQYLAEESWVSVLAGRIQDHADLMGVLGSLYSLQPPLISVELRSIESPIVPSISAVAR